MNWKPNAAPPANFPQKLSPDGPQLAGPFPTFSWSEVSGCPAYVIMLGRDPQLQDLLYTGRSANVSLAYPAAMRPLEPGTYYWRVIPVDERDQPISGLRGAQASFNVR